MDNNNRICYLSNLVNEGEKIIENLEKSIDDFLGFKNKYEEISKYYDSDEIKVDLEAEENGFLDKETNKSILAEDYAYELLNSYEKYLKIFKNFE